ncbi:MAG: exodeoxyribonuclease V subunit alpha [Desulfobacteraceae bacterium IS3]|nr:MAG: exodeoxyribonuclease V subunit alpha [Desulfobacteraceae bacterium IS3]
MKQETINRFYENLSFSPLDIHFKNFAANLAQKDMPEISLAAALVSLYKGEGHICVQISPNMEIPITQSESEEWLGKLRKSIVVGKPGEYKPLILDDKSRLYLYRYWEYQEKLAEFIRNRIAAPVKDIDINLLEQGLERFFPPNPDADESDWQKIAAQTALTRKFCVISGGPGTGKTTTVTKILALLLAQNRDMKIALAAPTGKAAARLQEAILREKKKAAYETVRDSIPEAASTLHRLLGAVADSPYFRHNAKNPLSADVVVTDEASMVDMALMSKLVQSLLPETRLILLGDKDQLASVEAGAVLGDICDSGCDGIVQLQKSYRFGAESGIGEVSRAVNAGKADDALRDMRDGNYADICWKNLPSDLNRQIRDSIFEGFSEYLNAVARKEQPMEIFRNFERFRILCALREGPYGVNTLNSLTEEILKTKHLIRPYKTAWYAGRPVMITRNDYNLHLFNGDVGLMLPDPESKNELRVFFPVSGETMRKLHPLRLPEHETVYAMTVHKSQGSEFEKVLLLLPDKDSPVLTRELVYTGITRAIKQAELWGTEAVFRTAVSRAIRRTSGLRDALQQQR